MKSKIESRKSKIGRILIVDDEEIVHLTLKRLLESEGYAIDSVYAGEEALAKLDSGYDLLILDIRMPDMDGIEVLREIRKRELDIEVMILTGFATMESATRALNYGARGYLMKPIEDIPEFRRKIHDAVHMARLTRENKQSYEAIVSGRVDSLTLDGKLYKVPTLREENKEIFQRLMEVIRDAVVFLDFDGNITFANVSFAQIICESYQNLLGTRFDSYMAEEDQEKIIEVLARLSGGQVAVSIPAQLKTGFDSFLSVIISATSIYYKMEYRGMVMVISDITEIDKVRGKLELLAILVENAEYDMIFLVKPDGQIMECNRLARKSFGYSQSEMLSLNMGTLFKSRADERWEKIVASVEQESHWRGELLAVSKDGSESPVEITVSRPVSEANSSLNMICFARDLSERKRAEAAEAEAARAKAEIGQLEREIRSLERLSSSSRTTVTAQSFGIMPLEKGEPSVFHELVRRYEHCLDQALEQRAYKVEHNISEELRSMAEQLGFLKAGPRDVVEIHTAALRKRTKHSISEKSEAYSREARVMVVELMGCLASLYRNHSVGSKGVPGGEKLKSED